MFLEIAEMQLGHLYAEASIETVENLLGCRSSIHGLAEKILFFPKRKRLVSHRVFNEVGFSSRLIAAAYRDYKILPELCRQAPL
jgi:hypothetical protein